MEERFSDWPISLKAYENKDAVTQAVIGTENTEG